MMFANLAYLLTIALPCMGFLLGYLSSNAFPKPLSQADEEKYLALYAAGDETAKTILIEHNLRLVAHIAKKFESTGIDREDLISIGTIGLIKAINTFDTGKKNRIATYSARCIENEILMYIRSTKNSRYDCFLNDPIGQDKEGNEMSIEDTLGTDGEEVLTLVESKDDERLLWLAFEVLTPKEKYVLVRRYGLAGHEQQTQKQVARSLGISRSYVSRIEKKAVGKLQKEFDRIGAR